MVTRRMDWSFLILRIVLGLIFTAHGSQKLFGLFGGPGLRGTAEFFGETLALRPALPWAVLIACIEFFGGLFILVGLLTRFWAFLIAADMIGAIVKVHGPNGFFIQNGGFEYNVLIIAVSLALVIAGAGRLSPDWQLRRLRRGRGTGAGGSGRKA